MAPRGLLADAEVSTLSNTPTTEPSGGRSEVAHCVQRGEDEGPVRGTQRLVLGCHHVVPKKKDRVKSVARDPHPIGL